MFRETHQCSRSRHKIGQGKVYYRDTECITKLYLGSRRLLKEDASRRSTSIEYEFEDPVLEVLVDRYQIQQIIINLVTNAVDAMQDIDRQPLLRIRIRNSAGGHVLTEFIDNGPGLPNDCADKIFDAFVSTKENGMGIGLAISRSIVEAHDGELWAVNNPGFGATFSLLLKGSGASQA